MKSNSDHITILKLRVCEEVELKQREFFPCVTMRMNWCSAVKLNASVYKMEEEFHYLYSPGVSTLVSSCPPVGEGSVWGSVHRTRKQKKRTNQWPLKKESHTSTYRSRSYNKYTLNLYYLLHFYLFIHSYLLTYSLFFSI